MQTIKRSILAVTFLVVFLLILYPPFMCIDPQSGGQVHAAIGHYAIWNIPPPEFVFRILYPNTPELIGGLLLLLFKRRYSRAKEQEILVAFSL